MSRKFDRSPLPSLAKAAGKFAGFSPADNKLRLVITMLRKLITKVRLEKNVPFYSMRELAGYWGVPLRTIALAFQELESEGLLVRLRGSHTKVLGHAHEPISHISGVVGVPAWLGGLSHYEHRRRFIRTLGESLWSHRLVTDVVFYWHSEDFHTDFVDRLLRHQLDYLVWFQPFRRHINIIESLRDRGVRTIAICDEELRFMPGQIGMSWKNAYRAIFRAWSHEVTTVAIVEPPPYLAGRLRLFEQEAESHGLKCLRLAQPADICRHSAGLGSRASETAFAFLDQYGPLEFLLRRPPAFVETAVRHRIFFGRDCPNIPFEIPPELRIDRATHPAKSLVSEISRRLSQWRVGNFEEAPVTFDAEAEAGLVVADSQELTSLVLPMDAEASSV